MQQRKTLLKSTSYRYIFLIITILNLKGINVGIITSNSNDKSEQILIQKGENEDPFVKLKPSKKVTDGF